MALGGLAIVMFLILHIRVPGNASEKEKSQSKKGRDEWVWRNNKIGNPETTSL